MRSTLTVQDNVDKKLRDFAEREHISYKDAVNLVLAKGLERLEVAESAVAYSVRPFELGLQTGIDADKLNQLSDDPELPE